MYHTYTLKSFVSSCRLLRTNANNNLIMVVVGLFEGYRLWWGEFELTKDNIGILLEIPLLCPTVMMMMSDYPCVAMACMRHMYLSHLCWICIYGSLSWQYINSMNCRDKVSEGCPGGRRGQAYWLGKIHLGILC